MLKDDEFQLDNVVGVDPIFGGLANEVLLLSTSGRVALDGVTAGTDDVVELRELDNVVVVVILEERLALEASGEDRLESPTGVFLQRVSVNWCLRRMQTYVMLLNDLLETRVVQLSELGEVVYVGDDVAQVFLQQVEILLERVLILASLLRLVFLRASDCGIDFFVRSRYTSDDLFALDAYEAVDLVEFLLELLDEALLRLLVPCVVHAEGRLEPLVVDVVEEPVLVQRLL